MEYVADSANPARDADDAAGVHIAVVLGEHRVLWVAAAAARDELLARLVGFLEPRAEYQLWEDEARQFRRLLGQRQAQRAVDLYFACAGGRWDEERLWIAQRALVDEPAKLAAAAAALPAPPNGGRNASLRRWQR